MEAAETAANSSGAVSDFSHRRHRIYGVITGREAFSNNTATESNW